MTMNTADQDRQAFVELPVIAKMLGLTRGQRIRLASLLAADPKLGGVRQDGTLPLATALKLAHAAKNR